jgi:Uma2 family endonuclease
MAANPLEMPVEYPISDGHPMAETTLHRRVMSDLIEALERHFASEPGVWVGGNLFLCWEKGNPRAAVAPDVLLARGVEKWDRPNYLLWEEAPPSLVVEVTSRSTRGEDLRTKKSLYERIGVGEYFLFDPYGEYLDPKLQGYRLESGCYEPIAPGREGSLESRTTGLTLIPEGERLRLVVTTTGERLLWPEEVELARREEARARREAESRAEDLERRNRALEEELHRLRRDSEGS